MKVMSFGYQKQLETKNFWNFSGQFSRYNIFQRYSFFFTRFPIQNFSSQLSRYHIFHSFSILKIYFSHQFFIRMRIIHPFSNLLYFIPKFWLQFFNFFSVMHFVLYLFFSNRIFYQGWHEGKVSMTVASGSRFWRYHIRPKKLLEWSPFTSSCDHIFTVVNNDAN